MRCSHLEETTCVLSPARSSGAGLFMFACVQTFFNKMATLLSATVMFSVIYSLFWFMPLLSLVGPEGKVGSFTIPGFGGSAVHQQSTSDAAARDVEMTLADSRTTEPAGAVKTEKSEEAASSAVESAAPTTLQVKVSHASDL